MAGHIASKVTEFLLAEGNNVVGVGNLNHACSVSPYAAKKAAEALAYAYHHLHGLDMTVLRCFTVYEPAGRPDMAMFRFAQWIHEGRPVTVYGGGQKSRDFTYPCL